MARKGSKRPSTRKTKGDHNKKALEQKMERLRQYVRNKGTGFLEDENISSIGIGYKIKKGKRTRQLCLQFTVKSKLEESGSLPEGVATQLIPEELEIGGEMIPTDVLERDYETSFQVMEIEDVMELADRKQRLDPIVPGISVSHPSGTAGTLGMIVFDRQTGDPCMLSNWHVLHQSVGEIGDIVVQPGPFDDNRTEQNPAGRLLRSHLGAAGDCAIARIEDRDFTTDIIELGVTPTRLARVELDDKVIKSGRTTGVTSGQVRRIDVMARITYAGIGPRVIGGFEIEPLTNAPSNFEVSMGGDSGSVWMIANANGTSTDILAGLHFAGETRNNPDEHALACYAHSVFRKLEICLTPSEQPEDSTKGYNPRFLSEVVPPPRLTRVLKEDAFSLNSSHLIPYTHFSVCQSKERMFPRFVAWNIDGARMKRISRRGIRFRRDPRVPDEFQAGNELYRNNPLDRGHVARRVDLNWGSLTEARQANQDSFYFTNITPQHQSFNQSSRGGLWGELENAILEDVDVEDLKVSVMAGPIFQQNDPRHRDVQIPREFWKLIAYRDTEDGRFKVKAFVLTQRDLLTNIEALELDEFRVFQVSLNTLRDETRLNFSALSNFDAFVDGQTLEALGPEAREIHDRNELNS